ncbi:MAG: hypothetical protein KAI39_01700 [Desulfobulbaceae bacterium]|nr:hypothetical protein [Desulfobulbaceae bacterium]
MTGNTTGKRKKMAAALAAVSLYLEQEEAAMDEQKESLTQSGNTGLSYWGHSGRQEMMDMRRLTQLRAIRY